MGVLALILGVSFARTETARADFQCSPSHISIPKSTSAPVVGKTGAPVVRNGSTPRPAPDALVTAVIPEALSNSGFVQTAGILPAPATRAPNQPARSPPPRKSLDHSLTVVAQFPSRARQQAVRIL